MDLPVKRTAFRLTGALLLATACLLTTGKPQAMDSHAAAAHDSGVVTIYLLRHAEKAKNDPRDPDLTEAGRQRAERLVIVLLDEPITHLFSTPLQRTHHTLAPLAAAYGLQITTIMDVQEQAEVLLSLPAGAVAVLAGHSNTVPALVAALGGQVSGTVAGRAGPQLHDDSHDRLFVALLSPAHEDGPARLLRLLQLRYGEP